MHYVQVYNLHDCTVQIRHPTTHTILGAGVVLASDGTIGTASAVLHAAGLDPEDTSPPAPSADAPYVIVTVPPLYGTATTTRRAVLVAALPGPAGIALLRLVPDDTLPPLSPLQVAPLGSASSSLDHPFRCASYGSGGNSRPVFACGAILRPADGSGGGAGTETLRLKSHHLAEAVCGGAVLDVARNLVVGIVVQTPASGAGTETPGDADIAHAVDLAVLEQAPFHMARVLARTPPPRKAYPLPRTDLVAARALAVARPGVALIGAPPPLETWAGREPLLLSLRDDWATPACHSTGLIGAAGTGKSSLVRHWLQGLTDDTTLPQPDGIFWWNFHQRGSVDEFFIAALAHFSNRRVDAHRFPSTSMRAQVLGAMLARGSYLLVLDGLDSLQYTDESRHGLLTSPTLREFLAYLAANDHRSYGILISRIPLRDMLPFVSYTHRDVERLTPADGYALLHQSGVTGAAPILEQLVAIGEGHAFTLGLLRRYLAVDRGGPVVLAEDVLETLLARLLASSPLPYALTPADFQRVVREYERYLSPAEHTLLLVLSAFRRPIPEYAVGVLLRRPHADTPPDADADADAATPPPDEPAPPPASEETLYAPLLALDDEAFLALFQRLVALSMLLFDEERRTFTLAPIIQHAYRARLADDAHIAPLQRAELHRRLFQYYLDIAPASGEYPTLNDLLPLIEAVYHACCAGAYPEAWEVYWERIAHHHTAVLVYQLGTHETALALLRLFFPLGNLAQEPYLDDPPQQQHVLATCGTCLTHLGWMDEAIGCYQRAVAIAQQHEQWPAAMSYGYTLAELQSAVGALDASASTARAVVALARATDSRRDEMLALATQAHIAHLRGKMTMAGATFYQAQAIERELNPQTRYLYSLRGVWHAAQVWQAGNPAYARHILETNRALCEQNHWREDLCRTERVLGDIAAHLGEHEQARQHYNQAVQIARTLPGGADMVIEALLARAQWLATRPNARLEAALAPPPPEPASSERNGDVEQTDPRSSIPIKRRRHRREREAPPLTEEVAQIRSELQRQSEQAATLPDMPDRSEPEPPPESKSEPEPEPEPARKGRRIAVTQLDEQGLPAASNGREQESPPAPAPAQPDPSPPPEPPLQTRRKMSDPQGWMSAPQPVESTPQEAQAPPKMPGRVKIIVDKTDARATKIERVDLRRNPSPTTTEQRSNYHLARNDLEEALTHAVTWGYRRYEQQIRQALRRVGRRGGEPHNGP